MRIAVFLQLWWFGVPMEEGRLKTRCRFSDGLMPFADIYRGFREWRVLRLYPMVFSFP